MVFATQQRSVEGMKRLTVGVVLVSMMMLIGCSGSEEMLQQQAQKIAEYEKQTEEMRTENTTLRQRMVKMEQDNKNLEARLTESEANVIAERDRANKAEEALNAAMTKPVQPMKETPKQTPREMPSSTLGAMSAYDEALGAVRARKYDDAIAKFEALLGAGVGDDWADNCHYWIGESQYAKKQYQEAIKHFEMAMNYPKSEKLGDAHYMMAQCYERMGDKAKAKEHYERVVKDYPTTTKVKIAKERWEKM